MLRWRLQEGFCLDQVVILLVLYSEEGSGEELFLLRTEGMFVLLFFVRDEF